VEKSYKLSWLERDALREITSMGAGNATTALSKLMKRRIDVTIPQLNLVSIQTVPEIMGGPERMATAIHSLISGDTEGSLVVLFDKASSLLITDILQGREIGTTKTLTAEDNKILQNMGNILSKSCLDALSEFLDLKLMPSEPGVATDMIKSLMDTVLIQFAKKSDYALLLEVEFDAPPTRVKGHFFLIFDLTTIETIVNAISKKLGRKKKI
jgi:chemotaxis protein CheC